MRFVTYEKNGEVNWGAIDIESGKIYPKNNIADSACETLLEQIVSGERLDNLQLLKNESTVDLYDVKLLAPIINPIRNVFCVGKNYLDHVKELSSFDDKQFSPEAELPIFFTKATTCINSPTGNVSLHKGITEQVDYEAELAIIIGKKGCNIKQENAYEHIFGYMVLNDFTARDLQKNHKQWLKGKSLDGYCPIGPWIVTKDEIKDPQNLDISLTVNGEVRQKSNTKNMIFSIARIIEDLSKGMTLLPGDIIATGTPSGVGAGFKPPRFLKQGDKVKVTIENVGEIENTII